MGDAAKRRATYEDVLASPPHVLAQVLNGVLHTHPRPGARHARAASRLGGELDGPFDRGRGGPGGWILLDEPELHLGEDIVVPDLAGWRRERMPAFPYDAAYFELAPDWICEVLFPSTAKLDRGEKLDVYARERVRRAWLLDPKERTLEVLRLAEGLWGARLVSSRRRGGTRRAVRRRRALAHVVLARVDESPCRVQPGRTPRANGGKFRWIIGRVRSWTCCLPFLAAASFGGLSPLEEASR